MFPPAVRLVLVLACLAAGGVGLASGSPRSVPLLLVAVLLAFGHFRYGPVRTAFRLFLAGDLERAEGLVRGIRRPRWLSPVFRSYREWILGAAELSRGRAAAAAEHLERAFRGRLRTPQARAAVAGALAAARLDAGDPGGAREMIGIARDLPHREGLETVLASIEEQLP